MWILAAIFAFIPALIIYLWYGGKTIEGPHTHPLPGWFVCSAGLGLVIFVLAIIADTIKGLSTDGSSFAKAYNAYEACNRDTWVGYFVASGMFIATLALSGNRLMRAQDIARRFTKDYENFKAMKAESKDENNS